jgi:hypothetical protein
MNSVGLKRAAIFALGTSAVAFALAACGGGESTSPSSTTTTTTTTTAPATPTEKAIDPTGGNKFSPTVIAPGPITPAPGNLPGNHPN